MRPKEAEPYVKWQYSDVHSSFDVVSVDRHCASDGDSWKGSNIDSILSDTRRGANTVLRVSVWYDRLTDWLVQKHK
jgi:hypothetical protein